MYTNVRGTSTSVVVFKGRFPCKAGVGHVPACSAERRRTGESHRAPKGNAKRAKS